MERRPWAFVAGGSGGIGAAVCRALADDGWNVVVGCRSNEEAASAVADEARALGAEALTARVDLTDAEATASVVQTCTGEVPLAGVVYASGPLIPMNFVSSLTSEQFRSQLEGDSVACFNLLQPALEQLRETSGAIVAISTPVIQRAFKSDLLSAAPKAAIEILIRHIAAEEGRYGIRANCVAVGVITDGMWDALSGQGIFTEKGLEQARRALPLGRFGTAAEVAEGVRFLMSSRASWTTGHTLAVDGGFAV